jgi:CheY-like chemotaxis protein
MNNCNFYVNEFKLDNMNQLNLLGNPSKLPKAKFINVIVADDEILNRQATVRTIYSISKQLDIKINIIEAEDGVETIYLVYKAATQGVKISMIFSDENMNFMTGSQSSEIVNEIAIKKCIGDIPFYLITAYDNAYVDRLNLLSITKILDKPISKNKIYEIIKSIVG